MQCWRRFRNNATLRVYRLAFDFDSFVTNDTMSARAPSSFIIMKAVTSSRTCLASLPFCAPTRVEIWETGDVHRGVSRSLIS